MKTLLDNFENCKSEVLSSCNNFNEAYNEYKLSVARDVTALKTLMIEKVMESTASDE